MTFYSANNSLSRHCKLPQNAFLFRAPRWSRPALPARKGIRVRCSVSWLTGNSGGLGILTLCRQAIGIWKVTSLVGEEPELVSEVLVSWVHIYAELGFQT